MNAMPKLKKPKKSEWSIRLTKFWGTKRALGIGALTGTHPLYRFEQILHELAHFTLIDVELRPNLGKPKQDVVQDAIENLPKHRQDLHEVRALAVEMEVLKRLGVRDGTISTVLREGERSCVTVRGCPDKYRRCVRRARKTVKVRSRADLLENKVREVMGL